MLKKRMAIAVAAIVICTMVLGSVPVSAATAVLQRESEGKDVKELQQELIQLGYLTTEATGYYGNTTEKAIKTLQKEYGYKADGIAGKATIDLLDRLLAKKKTAASGSSGAKLLKEGDENGSVADMQKKLIKLGYLNTNPTGFFGPATTSAVKKLQKKYGYEDDGVAGNATLALLSKLASGAKVDTAAQASAANAEDKDASQETAEAIAVQDEEPAKTTQTNFMPAWFGNVENTFAIGDVATVYDIKTGVSFKVKRTYGHNHADCETVSAKDTAIMKKLYGGKWSWDTRAVIVSVHGLKLAASIAGMPHAGLDKYSANKTISSRSGGYGRGTNLDKVKKNNMNGVFDLHFYKSRNHYNNKMDTRHQASVKTADKWAKEHYSK